MRLAIILLIVSSSMNAQKHRILFILNYESKVTHTKSSYNVISENGVSQDSADVMMYSRVGYCTFLNNDTARYQITKRRLSDLGLNQDSAYHIDYAHSVNRFRRPDGDIISKSLKDTFDFVIVLNHLHLSKNLFGSKVNYWYTVYDDDMSELSAGVFSSRIDLKPNMNWGALIQVFWEPSEAFEEYLLSVIDWMEIGKMPNGSSTSVAHVWTGGEVLLKDNSKMQGQIMFQDPYTIHFRLSPESPSRLLHASDVKSISLGSTLVYDHLFIHQISSKYGKYAFAKRVVSGKLILYQIGTHENSKFILYDTQTESKARVRFTPDRKRITNRSVISDFLADQPDLQAKLDDKRFGQKNLEKLIFLYNKR